MTLQILSLYVALGGAFSSVRIFRKNIAAIKGDGAQVNGTPAGLPPRPPEGLAKRLLLSQIFFLGVIVFEFTIGGWDLSQVGHNANLSPWKSIAAAIAIYGFLVLMLGAIVRLIGSHITFADATFVALRTVWPRSKSGKLMAFFAISFFNPITEEIFCRGVLVYALGQYLDNFAMPILMGLILTILGHLYQGITTLVFHTLFYAVAIMILFSPLGIAGAIVFHFAGDLVPIVTIRKQMNDWIQRRRQGYPLPSYVPSWLLRN